MCIADMPFFIFLPRRGVKGLRRGESVFPPPVARGTRSARRRPKICAEFQICARPALEYPQPRRNCGKPAENGGKPAATMRRRVLLRIVAPPGKLQGPDPLQQQPGRCRPGIIARTRLLLLIVSASVTISSLYILTISIAHIANTVSAPARVYTCPLLYYSPIYYHSKYINRGA